MKRLSGKMFYLTFQFIVSFICPKVCLFDVNVIVFVF